MGTEVVERNPELRVAAGSEGKLSRQNANNRVRLFVQVDCLPHRIVPCAEAMKPCPITQEHNVWSPRPIFARIEIAAKDRADTEGLKKLPLTRSP
jgi:hypothetical protein